MSRKIISILAIITIVIAGLFIFTDLGKTTVQSGVKQMFAKKERDSLAQPYVGITSALGVQEGLFPIRATGVSTAPIESAASALLSSLNETQKSTILFPIDDQEWRKWFNVDNGIYDRQGISLKDMTTTQKQAAFDLMGTSLSAKGLQLSRNIMKTDQTLRELNDDPESFDEELYFFTIMGTPSATEPWGWQLDGHHLVINFFVLGDQIVMTPVFMGAEPVITTSGKYEGNIVLQQEQDQALALMGSFTEEQQAKTTLSADKGNNNIEAEAASDNVTLEYAGIKASSMTEEQQAGLKAVIALYISNINDSHATVKMEEIASHWDNTYFAWIGSTDPNSVFYYRIHSPVVLIEFDHQAPVGVPGADRSPTRNHIHTIVRTPNGNDYGKDLLQQHLESHAH